MKAGDLVKVRGRKSQWFEKESGAPDRMPDYNALVVSINESNTYLPVTVMKADNSLWNVKKEWLTMLEVT
tara:strand:- start:186 stop:395 length:210 start_codon:yes stop_codon:yes gene_type:complete